MIKQHNFALIRGGDDDHNNAGKRTSYTGSHLTMGSNRSIVSLSLRACHVGSLCSGGTTQLCVH